MSDTVKVTMLGRFDLVLDGLSIAGRVSKSAKSVLLLKYLILHGSKPIPVSELVDAFWPDSGGSSNPENALKTMISRIRSNLTAECPALKNCILSENRSYMWNPQLDCQVDALRFEELCGMVRHVETLDNKARNRFVEILNLYGGELAEPSAEVNWLVSRSLHLHQLYLGTVYRFLQLLEEVGDQAMIIQVCRTALDVDTFDEQLNLSLMRALSNTGQNSAALTQYRHITSAHYRYLGTEPSQKLLDFYKQLIRADLAAEADIQTIRNELMRNLDADSGAFLCDYSIFKDIYQLQLRNIERQVSRMFLALISVDVSGEETAGPLYVDAVMRDLLDILKRCLRKGDTISRYSSTQYAILLPMLSYANGHTVMTRIRELFYQQHPVNTVTLKFHFDGIVPEDVTEAEESLAVT